MAIVFKLTNNNVINTEGTTLTLVDGTGAYNATTNPTGYGGANKLRALQSVFVLGISKSVKGDKQIQVQQDDPTSQLTTQFVAQIPKDGWYEFQMIVLQIYDPGGLGDYYNSGDFYYNLPTQEIYKVVDDQRADGLYTKIRIATLLELKDNPIYVKDKTSSFFVAFNSKIKLLINAKISDMLINNVDYLNKQLIRQKDNYNAVRAILQGAIYEYMRGNKFVAQGNIEFLNSNDYLKN